MEYIFGTNEYTGKETLRTRGAEHTDLAGFCQTVCEYPDCTVTDNFYVVEKTKSSEDAEGNQYDWYIIERHYRNIDKTKQIAAQTEQNASALVDVLLKILEG